MNFLQNNALISTVLQRGECNVIEGRKRPIRPANDFYHESDLLSSSYRL